MTKQQAKHSPRLCGIQSTSGWARRAAIGLVCAGTLFSVGLVPAALASDDFDCYSPDQRVWVSGKTAEDANGQEYFLGSVQVTFDETTLIDHIKPQALRAGSRPLNFSYSRHDYQLTVNWEQKVMRFAYTPATGAPYRYEGPVICD